MWHQYSKKVIHRAWQTIGQYLCSTISTASTSHIQQTQYGFRAKRSTAQPLYIARRLQDLAEESGENMILVFLDWEKAFDKVDQQKWYRHAEDGICRQKSSIL